MSKIYQDTEGNYHDLTVANLAEWPPADASLLNQPLQTVEADAELVGDGTGEALPDAPNQDGDTELVVERGTVEESGSDVTPVATEPDTAKAKTRKA